MLLTEKDSVNADRYEVPMVPNRRPCCPGRHIGGEKGYVTITRLWSRLPAADGRPKTGSRVSAVAP